MRLIFGISVFSFICIILLQYLLYQMPDSMFYQARRFISMDNTPEDRGVLVKKPALFSVCVGVFYLANFYILIGSFLSPFVEVKKSV